MGNGDELKNQLDVEGNEIQARTKMSPGSLFISLLHPDAVLVLESDQANSFVIGATLMCCFICRGTRQPDNSIGIILLSWLVASGFHINSNGRIDEEFW